MTPEETYYFQFYPGTEETWVDDKEEYIEGMKKNKTWGQVKTEHGADRFGKS